VTHDGKNILLVDESSSVEVPQVWVPSALLLNGGNLCHPGRRFEEVFLSLQEGFSPSGLQDNFEVISSDKSSNEMD